MGLLDNVERGLERVVNGAFARTFRSGLQPMEVSAALKRELDARSTMVTRERILAPHAFEVEVSSTDFANFTRTGTLEAEWAGVVRSYGAQQGYSFAGDPTVTLVENGDFAEGQLVVEAVDADTRRHDVAWVPVVEMQGERLPIVKARTVFGRGVDADITIRDSSASRRHFELQWDGERAQVKDLGSTNGTTTGGRRVTVQPVQNGTTITVGDTNMVFRIVPQTAPASSGHPGAAPSAASPAGAGRFAAARRPDSTPRER